MSVTKAGAYLSARGLADKMVQHQGSIDTVEHAAQQIGCTEAEIAKTLTFLVEDRPVAIVMAGDGKVNTARFKAQFHVKPHMIPRDSVNELVGHEPGGVCPFGLNEQVAVWLDVSLKRFAVVHAAAGDEFTSIPLSPAELEQAVNLSGWCDVCKGWQEEPGAE